MRACAALALVLACLAVWARSEHASSYRETLYVFGTLVEIVIEGEDPATARSAAEEVAQLLQQVHGAWHAWRPGALSTLNGALAQGRAAQVPARLARVLARAQELSCRSGGRFEPAIGALIGLWGFHQDTPPSGAPPASWRIAALRAAAPSMADLRIVGTRIATRNTAVELDLGGFAKGAALAEAAELLQRRGITDAVLNAGGDVTITGRHGDRAWRVAIRDPFVWGAVGSVSLSGIESLYTSGNYERYFEHDGIRFAHIIDPETGYPVQEIVSVSVLDADPGLADAAATALSVAGAADWPQVAADMGVTAVLVIDDAGRMYASPLMVQRLSPVGGAFPAPITEVPLPAPRSLACGTDGMAVAGLRGEIAAPGAAPTPRK